MHAGKLVFAQLMEHLPLRTFHQCVARYSDRYPTLKFSHLDRFLCMAFAQLVYRESLRDSRIYMDFAMSLIQTALRQRQLCCRAGTNGLRTRYHDHRLVLERLSLGTLSLHQGCR